MSDSLIGKFSSKSSIEIGLNKQNMIITEDKILDEF